MRRADQLLEAVVYLAQQMSDMSAELRSLLTDMQSREQELVKVIDKQARHIEALELDLHLYDRDQNK